MMDFSSARDTSTNGHIASSSTLVVADERYSDARLFTERLIKQGAKPFFTREDVVHLWYRKLRSAVIEHQSSQNRLTGKNRLTICGLTTTTDFELLQQCLRELDSHVTYKIIHDGRSRHSIKYHLSQFVNGEESTNEIVLSRNWAVQAADLFVGRSQDCGHFGYSQSTDTTTKQQGQFFPGCLVAWSFC